MSDQTTQRRFFSSSTLERAVLEAAGHYGLEPEQLAYTKLEKRGVASRGKVSIKVNPSAPAIEAAAPGAAAPETVTPEAPAEEAPSVAIESPEESDQAAAEPEAAEEPVEEPVEEEATASEPTPEPSSESADAAEEAGEEAEGRVAEELPVEALSDDMADLPRTSAEARRSWSQTSGPLEQAARKWTESLLRVASLDLDVEIYERGGELEIHLGGADAEVAVEDGGEVLRSIQHLLPRLMLGTVGESVHCKVDCNDFRELHEERLRAQALGAAAEAVAERGEVTLDPMHPADRRIVHLVLADNELVRTESLGRGFFKRVSIRGN